MARRDNSDNGKCGVVIISVGGTIEKSYDESDGSLANRESLLQQLIIQRMRLPYHKLSVVMPFSKDSLDMSDEDRSLLLMSVKAQLSRKEPIVVIHGTDTMARSARYIQQEIGDLEIPIVFTGAMRPMEFRDSDGYQNVCEALYASTLTSPGVYISFHGRLLPMPHVRKNLRLGTFEAHHFDGSE
ncbi:MAG: asparaginase [Bdellovibrionales bacterium]|jgi:L-asparaginase|nr:asparaginase [Bdellovibrionales bacterium]MBT3526182.1 asparaginase [Bdellovibrionales bacterium]